MSFQEPLTSVNNNEPFAQLTVSRQNASAPACIHVTTTDGTAKSGPSTPSLCHEANPTRTSHPFLPVFAGTLGSVSFATFTTQAAEDVTTFDIPTSAPGCTQTILVVASALGTVDVYSIDQTSNLALLQSLPSSYARKVRHFSMDGADYLVVVNRRNVSLSDPRNPANSVIYVWDPVTWTFSPVQWIPTWNAYSVAVFQVSLWGNTTTGIAIAQFQNSPPAGTQTATPFNSTILLWSATEQQFVTWQSIPTFNATDVNSVTIGNTLYLAFANYGSAGSYLADSQVYTWNDDTALFEQFQAIPTKGCRALYFHTRARWTFLIAVNHVVGMASYNVPADVYFFNKTSGQFQWLQSLPMYAGTTGTSFILHGISYLAFGSRFNAALNHKTPLSAYYFDTATKLFAPAATSMYLEASEALWPFWIGSNLYLASANFVAGSISVPYANTPPTTSEVFQIYASGTNMDYVALDQWVFLDVDVESTYVLVDLIPIATGTLKGNKYFDATATDDWGNQASTEVEIIGNTQINLVDPTEVFVTEDFGASENPRFVATLQVTGNTTAIQSWSIVSGDAQNSFFINADGQLWIVHNLDREKIPSDQHSDLVLAVSVADASFNTGLFDIVVSVGDLDDNQPILSANAQASIYEQNNVGSNVIQIQASDLDSVIIANYSILSTVPWYAGQKPFIIDASTGVITTAVTFNFDVSPIDTFTVTVQAEDSSLLQYFSPSVSTLVVHILHIDNHAPIFAANRFDAIVSESLMLVGENKVVSPLGQTVIAGIEAVDHNDGIFSGVVFTLSNNPYFDVTADGSNAKIVTIALLPFSFVPGGNIFNLTLTACSNVSAMNPWATRACSNASINIEIIHQVYPPVITGTTIPASVANQVVYFDGNNDQLAVVPTLVSGSNILQVFASDPAFGLDTPINFKISNWIEGNAHAFAIDESTGIISVAAPLVASTKSVFSLTAYIQAVPDQWVSQDITIYVIGDIDFTQSNYDVTYYDVSPILFAQVFVPSLTWNANDVAPAAVYSVTGGTGLSIFAINNITGAINVAVPLLYNSNGTNTYTLELQAVDWNVDNLRLASALLTIQVVGLYNQAPSFAQSLYQVQVYEDAENSDFVAHVIVQVTASEPDISRQLTYALLSAVDSHGTNSIPFFAINELSGAISAVSPLDYEVSTWYTLQVAVFDGIYNATTQVHVSVLNLNDGQLYFDQSQYTAYIPNSPHLSTQLAVVSVSVYDGLGTRVRFWLRGSDAQYFTTSVLSAESTSASAAIAMTAMIPLEQTSFSFSICASEIENARVCVPVIIVKQPLTVSNVGLPVFLEQSVNAAVTISENTQSNTSIIQLFAYINDDSSGDSASGDTDFNIDTKSATLKFSIISGDSFGFFRIDPATGVVYLNGHLTAQFAEQYSLTIQVQDQSSLYFTQTTLTVHVASFNDHAPSFTQAVYTAAISENTPLTTPVVQVTASDLDSGYYGTVAFSIIGGDEWGLFRIEPSSGQISVASNVDYEALQSVQLVIQARDNVEYTSAAIPELYYPYQTATATVSIKIVDINDNTPKFSPSAVFLPISENFQLGESLLELNATDKDLSFPYNVLAYKIISGNDLGYFAIASDHLVLVRTLDFEVYDEREFTLQIAATDHGIPPRTSSSPLTVRISVMDVNDVAPIFLTNDVSVRILKGNPLTNFFQVRAVDIDFVDCGQLKFTIVSATPALQGSFSINAGNGFLSTTGLYVDVNQVPAVILTIQVTDSNNVHTIQTTVTVIVVDPNDNPPVFIPNSFVFSVLDNATIGTIIGDAHAVDAQDGPASQINYAIVAGNTNATFWIDSNGNIILSKKLHSAIIPVFSLLVLASNYNSTFHSTATVIIQVISSSLVDNLVFVSDTLHLFVPSGLYDISIGQIEAVSRIGLGKGQVITYGFDTNAFSSIFTIDAASGAITCLVALNITTQNQYALSVYAWVNSVPVQITHAMLIITVLPYNQHAPQFLKGYYSIAVSELTANATTIKQIQAFDQDGNALVYTLNDEFRNAAGVFDVNSQTGEIVLIQPFDRQDQASYLFKLSVTDGYHVADTIVSVSVDSASLAEINAIQATLNQIIINGGVANVSVLTTPATPATTQAATSTANADTNDVYPAIHAWQLGSSATGLCQFPFVEAGITYTSCNTLPSALSDATLYGCSASLTGLAGQEFAYCNIEKGMW